MPLAYYPAGTQADAKVHQIQIRIVRLGALRVTIGRIANNGRHATRKPDDVAMINCASRRFRGRSPQRGDKGLEAREPLHLERPTLHAPPVDERCVYGIFLT